MTVRFLIIRFSSIGDIVLTTPVVRHLKKQVEGAEIHYLTKDRYEPLLKANPYIDRLWLLKGSLKDLLQEMKGTSFDYVIDLHNNLRTAFIKNALHRISFEVNKLNFRKWLLVRTGINRLPDRHIVDRYMDTIRLFDILDDQHGLDYFIPVEDEIALSSLPEPFNGGYIILVAGAMHQTKKIPLTQMVSLCRKLEKPIIIVGGPEDKVTGEEIVKAIPGAPVFNGCGKFSINQSASLIRQALLVISPDTGMMHIAAAFGKRILSVWGNTVPAFGMSPFRPGDGSRIFEVEGLRCRPCSKIGYARCPKKHFHCMQLQDMDGIAREANR